MSRPLHAFFLKILYKNNLLISVSKDLMADGKSLPTSDAITPL
jgi:hypothetical protein